MKTVNILFILASALCIAEGYDISCSKYYTTSGTEKCLSIVNKKELSLKLFATLNPDLDCDNALPDNTVVCISGKPIISTDGTCGPKSGSCPFGECCSNGKCGNTKSFCGTSCDPKYGLCSDLLYSGSTKSSKKSSESFDTKSINTIANIFAINKTNAKKFYDFSNQAVDLYDKAFLDSVDSNLSVKLCQKKCLEANTQFKNLLSTNSVNFSLKNYNSYLKSIGNTPLDETELLDFCINQCYVIKELNDYVNEKSYTKSYKSNSKRDNSRRDKTKCYPTSEAKFNVVTNYLHGYNKYTETSDSVITALTFVNGCSIPVIKDLYNANNNGLFVPACNTHDICYGCQGGKAKCDTTFLNNMRQICKDQKKNSLICRGTANVFYAAVKIGAKKNYDACSSNRTEKTCAYCGAPLIQNVLLSIPYYTV